VTSSAAQFCDNQILRWNFSPMKRSLNVEIARLFGLVCVVAAHANSLETFRNFQTTGFLVDEACRSTVQLFFLVSGFFWKPDNIDRPGAYLARLFPKLAIPFVLWAAIYLTLDWTGWLYPGIEDHSWRSYITTPWSGGIAFHLWFLPALFIGTAIGLTMIRMFGLRGALYGALILFLIGALLGAYLRPFGIHVPLGAYRNGIFFAPIFLVSGYYLKGLATLPKFSTFLVVAVVGAVGNLLEGIYIVGSYPNGHDLSLATLPFGIGVFGLFLHLRSEATTLASWGRDVFGAYLAHVLIMKTLIAVIAPQSSLWLIAFVIIVTLILSLIFSRYAKKNRWLQYLAP
jgi:surface polysaccharide O-acyltransferase-like enzyme